MKPFSFIHPEHQAQQEGPAVEAEPSPAGGFEVRVPTTLYDLVMERG